MRVRMLDTIVGPSVAYIINDEPEIPDAEARRYIAAGLAEPVTPRVDGDGVDARWEMRIPPHEYLRRFPNGPNAELAALCITTAEGRAT